MEKFTPKEPSAKCIPVQKFIKFFIDHLPSLAKAGTFPAKSFQLENKSKKFWRSITHFIAPIWPKSYQPG